jgi:hypothetical protein
VSLPETLEPARFGHAAYRHAQIDRDIPGPLTAFLLLPNFNNIQAVYLLQTFLLTDPLLQVTIWSSTLNCITGKEPQVYIWKPASIRIDIPPDPSISTVLSHRSPYFDHSIQRSRLLGTDWEIEEEVWRIKGFIFYKDNSPLLDISSTSISHGSPSRWPIMVTDGDQSLRSSVHVAPLSINKDRSRGSSSASSHRRNLSSRSSNRTGDSRSSQSQMTPPATPNSSQEDLRQHIDPPQPVFHNFLRAFYPFHPTFAISDTTVTLPLNEGDVILVHSIHTNGWADGTLLVSGARGWLPTNYCEAYDPDYMKNLLKALLNFWDLLRSPMTRDSELFANQEFMRGIIAGVRYLLVRTMGYQNVNMNGLTISRKDRTA